MNIKNKQFNKYNFDDFMFDDSFINYATNSNQIEVSKWEKWLSSNPNNISTAEEAKLLIRHLRFKKQELSNKFIQDEWIKLKYRLKLDETSHSLNSKTILQSIRWQYIAAVASIILLFLSAIYFFSLKPKCDEMATYYKIIVPKGEIKKVWLPDSTLVYINSDSELKYNNCFDENNRDVFLKGEAFFDVKYMAKKPFIVHTQETNIIVLGTAFNVYAYPNDNIFRASLERGKIAISPNDKETINLKVNQTFISNKNNNQSKVIDSENIQTYSSWKEGQVIFRNQSFTSMLRILERSHNVIFILQNDDVGKCKYTGSFAAQDDIKTILGVIKLPTPFDFEILNDTIIIK